MKLSNKYFIPLLLLLLALGMNLPALSQSTMDIQSMFDQNSHMGINFIPGNNNPADLDAIRVYEAQGHTRNLSDFTLIREYDMSNYPNVDSVTWNSQMHFIQTTKAGNFPYLQNMSYFMTAVIGNNESTPPDSMYYTYFNEPIDSLYFNVNPPSLTIAEVGEQFLYNPSAFTSGLGKINYKLVDPPNNDAIINKNTGLLTYNATQAGDFTFIIRAYLETQTSTYIEQEMRVRVLKCKTYITGNLTSKNQSLESISRLSYDIYKLENDSSVYYSSGALGNNNQFKATVGEGKYQVMINGYTKNEQIILWYNNTKYMNEAKILETTCGNDISFEWEVDLTAIEKETITLLPINEKNGFDINNKGDTFEKEIEFTVTPAGSEVDFSLTYNKNFILTGPDNNILKLDTQEPGIHQTVVNATMKNNSSIRTTQLVTVLQNKCDELTKVTVNIKDKETGELYKETLNASMYLTQTVNDSTFIVRSFNSDTLSSGILVFNLPSGDYKLDLMVNSKNQMGRYVYTYNREKPTNGPFELIEVGCNDLTLDWEIRTPKEVKSYTISGYAKDENTDEAIQYSQIDIVGKNKLTDEISRKYTYTNDNGYYTIDLLNNEIYTVSAHSAYDSIDINPYLREYWEETANPLEATVIDLTGNLENINFTLEERSEYKNTLNGIVLNEDDEGIEDASIIAYLIEPTAFDVDLKYWATSGYTDSKGEFEFENLIPGEYIVYSSTNKRDHIPGYYESDDETLTRSWLDATRIEVEETGSFGDLELRLAPLKPIASNKGLSGKVGRMKGVSPGSSAILNPLNGVQVFVTNSDDKVINYNYSEKDGEYDVPNLENGELNIYFDKVGFKMAHEQIIITDNNENIELDVEMEGLSTSDVTPFEDVNASLYPNPSTGNVTITGDFNYGSYLVKVVSMTGSTVKIIPIEIAGTNVSLDLSGLYSGQYYIQLIGSNANYSTKVNIIK